MNKRCLSNVLLLVLCAMAYAQSDTTKVARDVTIEREYNPVIMDAKKVNQNLQVLEPDFEKKAVVYSTYEYPMQLQSPSKQIPQAPLTVMERKNYKKGFAELALAVPLNWDVNFAYPLISTSDCALNFSINHEGWWWNGKTKSYTYKDDVEGSARTWNHQQHYDTRAALNFAKDFSSSELYSNLFYRNRAFNYYGTNEVYGTRMFENNGAMVSGNELLTRFNRFNDLAFNIGYKALPGANFFYDVQAAYNLFAIPSNFAEHQVDVLTRFSIPIGDNKLAFKLGVENLLYSALRGYEGELNKVSSVIEFSPKFSILRDAFHLHIGLKSFFAINRGNVVNVSPDVELEYFINPRVMSFYVGVGGGYELNSMRSLYRQNWYLDIAQNTIDTYTPFDAYLGFKIKPVSHLFVDAFVRYKLLFGEAFFKNKEYATAAASAFSNRFVMVGDNWQLLNVGLHLNYNFKDVFDIFFKGQYNGWYRMAGTKSITGTAEAEAWYRPVCELNVGGDVNIKKDWRVSASYRFEGRRMAQIHQDAQLMRAVHDINLEGSYTYNNWLTSYLKVDNLLGMIPQVRYQRWYGYDVLGAVKLGVIFAF